MTKLTADLTAKLDDCIVENFADIYVFDSELDRIAKKHDLADPEVIAAMATVADVGPVQKRLIAQPLSALVKGLKLAKPMRPTAKLLAAALLDGAERASTSTPGGKSKLPAFARPERLPPLVDAKGKRVPVTEEFLNALAKAKLGDAPKAPYTPASLAQLGRALVLGWLSHGAEPKRAWAAWAAGHFPDDATARDLGMMARELGPRVGQFSKAQILVDVLAAMNSRVAMEQLHELSTKVKTRSVKDRAKAAFDEAAKRSGISTHDLADKLLPDDAPVGKDFVRRLEQRMVNADKMSAVELVENILQRDAVRERARGVVFGAKTRSKVVTFTIGADGSLVDIDGKPYTLPSSAKVIVVYPLDLSAKQLEKWQKRIAKAPFAQLDRPIRSFASVRAMRNHVKSIKGAKQGAIYGLENLGWRRGEVIGGRFFTLTRALDGVTAAIEFEPGIYLGRGMPVTEQRIIKITIKGDGPARAMAEVARELDTLAS